MDKFIIMAGIPNRFTFNEDGSENLVKMMQGNIMLNSKLHKGSTFTVELPRVVEVDTNGEPMDKTLCLDIENMPASKR